MKMKNLEKLIVKLITKLITKVKAKITNEKHKTDFQRGLKKIGILDIESTGLRFDFGYILCVCIKEVNEHNMKGKTHTIRIDDPRNPDKFSDKWVIEEVIKLMNKFDLLIGWNSSQFDFKGINSRAIKHKLKPPIKQYRRDILYVARANFRIRNNRLATWDEFLFGKNSKTAVNPDIWFRAMRNEKKALNFIVDHCVIDVRETEKVYKRFIPFLGKKLKRGGI